MKKRFLSLLFAFGVRVAFGQAIESLQDRYPHQQDAGILSLQEDAMFTEAHFDLQFAYNALTASGANGQAAVAYINGEIWSSRWQNDTLYRYDSLGNFLGVFKILNNNTPISGTRAIAFDGTDAFVVNNTATIFVVDTGTKAVKSTFTNNLAGGMRWITYDPTANSGAGGFWVGSFNTELRLISRTGATLSSILAATHGINGMYGAAFDTFSVGGPYLWVFSQTNAGTVYIVQTASGLVLPQTYDIVSLLPTQTNPIAGGCFITPDLRAGAVTFLGLMQGNPNYIFGLELDFQPPNVDAILRGLSYSPPYGKAPLKLVTPLTVSGNIFNGGVDTLTSLSVDLDVFSNTTLVSTQNQSLPALSAYVGAPFSFSFTPPGKGQFALTATANTGAQIDEFPTSNTFSTAYEVTDSVYARDNGIANASSYSVSSNGKALAIAVYDFPQRAFIKGVELILNSPTAGDTTFPVLVLMQGNNPSGGPILTGPPAVVSDTVNRYYLPFQLSLPLQAGTRWGIGVAEDTGPLGIAAGTGNFVPGINFFTTNLNTFAWTPSNLTTIRFIRPVIATCERFGGAVTVIPDSGQNTGALSVAISGQNGSVTYAWTDSATGASAGSAATISNLAAGTYYLTATDQNDCVFTDTVQVIRTLRVSLETQLGLSRFSVYPNPASEQLFLDLSWARPVTPELALLDLQGREVRALRLQRSEAHQASLQVSALAAGLYTLRIRTKEGQISRLISIQ